MQTTARFQCSSQPPPRLATLPALVASSTRPEFCAVSAYRSPEGRRASRGSESHAKSHQLRSSRQEKSPIKVQAAGNFLWSWTKKMTEEGSINSGQNEANFTVILVVKFASFDRFSLPPPHPHVKERPPDSYDPKFEKFKTNEV